MDKDKKNIILVGGGGHCKSCIEVINSTAAYNIVGILDLPSKFGHEILGIRVIGNDDDYLKFHRQGCVFLITMGQIKSPNVRKEIFSKLKAIDARVESIIAPTASVAPSAIIDEGTVIMKQAVINADVKIGVNNIINTAAIIEHDVSVGMHNHISTGVVINGGCEIGDENFFGSGACLVNGVSVSNKVVVGAGTIVISNLLQEGTYVGNPAKKIK